jgi:hypothetical protein
VRSKKSFSHFLRNKEQMHGAQLSPTMDQAQHFMPIQHEWLKKSKALQWLNLKWGRATCPILTKKRKANEN